MTDADPLWYKDAVIYQLHVRGFQDGGPDGIGDFKGLRQRLDYLQDLGVTALWLQPFYPSPLRDDGYDIADYTNVHPQYGTLDDFQAFLDAAHRRGLRVITELVINHTSDQHPWFQRARRAPKGSPERDFYVWSDDPHRYREARIIFQDFERSNWTWDPVAEQYFWHRFYSHQPDLNFDNPAVFDALTPVLDFWMDMGVDGMRLDAIPYLVEREGTNCENLPETHAVLKRLRAHLDAKFPGRMFLAEANQWPEDAVHYFGDGDECHMAFHFPVMPRLYMALVQEDRFPIVDILEQTPAIPDTCQWCMFLRNHDELTLEMVTDEERDSMYRAYAADPQARINLGIRRRLAPLLNNDRRRIELMNALLFSMPGTPVVYYGDEIGMGDNIYLGDRNGVRTPMQWSGDRNAGFSRANPQKLYAPVVIDPEYHYEAVNVEAQQGNPSSLLWWTKRLIALRKQFRAFGRGAIEFLRPDNHRILAFVRRHGDEAVLVVANLSRFVQYAQLDLSGFRGLVPVELVGRTPFPAVGDGPYPLTLGPHGVLWFALTPQPARPDDPMATPREAPVPRVVVRDGWDELLDPARFDWLEPALAGYLAEVGTGRGSARAVREVAIRSAARLPLDLPTAFVVVDAHLADGTTEMRALPLRFVPEAAAGAAPAGAVVASLVKDREPVGVLIDARADAEFYDRTLDLIAAGGRVAVDRFDLVAVTFPGFAAARGPAADPLPVTVARAGRRHVTVRYGDRLVMKTADRLEPGPSPAVELGRFLGERTGFDRMAPVVGAVGVTDTRSTAGGPPLTVSVLYGHVPNEGDGWQYTLDVLSRFYEAVLADPLAPPPPAPAAARLPGADVDPPADAADRLGGYLAAADDLGRLTADMHKALASGADPGLAPEPFGKLYQRSVYQAMRTVTGLVFRDLGRRAADLPGPARAAAAEVLGREADLTYRFRGMLGAGVTGSRIRVHGDYHLGRLLHTGTGFVVIGFEGDPDRPASERRIKRSPLRDVASMVRSFDYAALAPVYGFDVGRAVFPGQLRAADRPELLGWARFWASWASARFVRSYLAAMAGSPLLPADPDVCRQVLELLVIEQAVRELGAELEADPARAVIPLTGLAALAGESALA